MSAEPDSPAPGELYCPTCERTYGYGDRCPDDGTRLVRLSSGADTLIGRELDGRYTITQQIGQGGMGTVYRGNQHSVGREVAIKVVLPKLVSESVTVKRFLREAKLASRLSHPNAVSVLDFGQTSDGLFYLVMELVNGRTLDAVLAKEAALPQDRVVRIATQICDALEGAHQLQIVHRDLKPANVMLLSTGRDLVKVLDFGLAKSLQSDAKQTMVTNEGQLLGTPAYMPPELVTGGACDGRADLYSLGCVMYRMLTGKPPFIGNSAHEIIAMHVAEPPKPIPGLAPGLATVLERLMAKDPDHRYQNAVQAREALEDAFGSADPEASLPTTVAHQTPGTMLGWEATSGSQPFAKPLLSRTSSREIQRPSAPSPQQHPSGQQPQYPMAGELSTSGQLSRLPPTPSPNARPAPTPTQIQNTPTSKAVYVVMALALLVIAGAIVFALVR